MVWISIWHPTICLLIAQDLYIYSNCCCSTDSVSFQRPLEFDLGFLISYVMALCVSVGQDPPVVPVRSVPASVAPQITTASITNTRIAHTATRTTRHPIAVPLTKSITTKKPPSQPSVTKAKEAGVTSLRLSTVSAETTAAPRQGILERLPPASFIDVSFMIYSVNILQLN